MKAAISGQAEKTTKKLNNQTVLCWGQCTQSQWPWLNPSNFCSFLKSCQRKTAEMHSPNAVAILCTVSACILFILRLTGWKHICEILFYFPMGIASEEVIFGTKVPSQFTHCLWRTAVKGATFALQFICHYNQSSRCSKLPNETFHDVISAVCQRTWRVWMWWLMSIWSHQNQRKTE